MDNDDTAAQTELREKRIRGLMLTYNDHPENEPDGWTVTPKKRFAMVERNVRDERVWMTGWDDLDAAGRYHTSQEDAWRWQIVRVVDLDTGSSYRGRLTVEWTDSSSR